MRIFNCRHYGSYFGDLWEKIVLDIDLVQSPTFLKCFKWGKNLVTNSEDPLAAIEKERTRLEDKTFLGKRRDQFLVPQNLEGYLKMFLLKKRGHSKFGHFKKETRVLDISKTAPNRSLHDQIVSNDDDAGPARQARNDTYGVLFHFVKAKTVDINFVDSK